MGVVWSHEDARRAAAQEHVRQLLASAAPQVPLPIGLRREPSGRTRTAAQALRSAGLRIWSVLFATLARRAQERNSALTALAGSGRLPPRDSTKRQDRERFAQVCVTCGRCDLPPGRPGRTCQGCRKPDPCQDASPTPGARPIPA